MPREGAIVFADLIGKLDMLRIECAKCGRSGRYRVADLVMRYGRHAKLFAFTDDVTANCTRKHQPSDSDPCAARCPDLSKVFRWPSRRPKRSRPSLPSRSGWYGGRKTWIAEHQRGDASLGHVLHDYAVEKGKPVAESADRNYV
jgi:hypothetical protein